MNPRALDWLNALPEVEALEVFRKCCGSERWAGTMAIRRPFASPEAVHTEADVVFKYLEGEDWLTAFSHHPRIGDMDSLRKKFAQTRTWSAQEQSAAASASEETLQALADGNREYERRFGYIFIVCATGKSAEEMLELLHERLNNDAVKELAIAAAEQQKITHIRLEKLEAP